MIEGVLYTDAHTVWPRIEGWIQACLDKMDTGYTSEDLLTEVQLRRKQLWLIDDKAVGITSIIVFPQWKKLVVEYVAGEDLSAWHDEFYEEMTCYAEAFGCKYVEIQGRKGWIKLAKAKGDSVESYTIARKAL